MMVEQFSIKGSFDPAFKSLVTTPQLQLKGREYLGERILVMELELSRFVFNGARSVH